MFFPQVDNIKISGTIVIMCYNEDACDALTIISTTDNIYFTMYHYSKEIQIYTPSGYNQNHFNCNPNNVSFYYNGMTASFEDALRIIYRDDIKKDGYLPCESIVVTATNIDDECEFAPKFDINLHFQREIQLKAKPYFECYWPVLVNNIMDWGCKQEPTVAPTYSPIRPPTMPTLYPTETPTKKPTKGPSFAPTISPSYSPTGAPTDLPSPAPSQSPTTSPTRFQINHKDFEYFIAIKYQITGLWKDQFEKLIQN
eukprot:215436_1